MGAVFANAPIQPTCVEVQVLSISFDARSRLLYRRDHEISQPGRIP
jgi:hypothetical protein